MEGISKLSIRRRSILFISRKDLAFRKAISNIGKQGDFLSFWSREDFFSRFGSTSARLKWLAIFFWSYVKHHTKLDKVLAPKISVLKQDISNVGFVTWNVQPRKTSISVERTCLLQFLLLKRLLKLVFQKRFLSKQVTQKSLRLTKDLKKIGQFLTFDAFHRVTGFLSRRPITHLLSSLDHFSPSSAPFTCVNHEKFLGSNFSASVVDRSKSNPLKRAPKCRSLSFGFRVALNSWSP